MHKNKYYPLRSNAGG